MFECGLYNDERIVMETAMNANFNDLNVTEKFDLELVFKHPYSLGRYMVKSFNTRKSKLYKLYYSVHMEPVYLTCKTLCFQSVDFTVYLCVVTLRILISFFVPLQTHNKHILNLNLNFFFNYMEPLHSAKERMEVTFN